MSDEVRSDARGGAGQPGSQRLSRRAALIGGTGIAAGTWVAPAILTTDAVAAQSDTTSTTVPPLDGCYIAQFGSHGSADGQFRGPAGVAWDSTNRHIVVMDVHNERLQTFDDTTYAFVARVATNGYGIAFDATHGRIIVADGNNNRVRVFDAASLALVSQFGSFGSGPGEFFLNQGVAWDGTNGRIIVTDYVNNRVQLFDDTTFAFLAQFGVAGTGNGEFQYPYGAVWDPSHRRILVADQFNNRIQVFDGTTFAYLTQFGGAGSGNGQFDLPAFVEWDSTNRHVIVSDGPGPGHDRIQYFDDDTYTFIKACGRTGSADGEFIGPAGVAWIPPTSQVAVADGNNRVQLLVP